MPLKRSTANEYKKRVCSAMNFISHNLDRELSLEEIATEATFSPFHFHRIFKAATGETVTEFSKRLRLEKAACELSMNQDSDITDIAFKYNFSSSQNFAKAFRKHFQMSPSEYRKQKNCRVCSNSDNPLSFSPNNYSSIFGHPLDPKTKLNLNVEIKELPEYRLAYVRKVGRYCKETCEPAFYELGSWAGPKGLFTAGKIISIYWDNPEVTPPEKCRMDGCIIIPDDFTVNPAAGIGVQTIPAGSYAIFNYELDESQFQQAWTDSFKWIIENGYECANRHCYEQYNNDPKEHQEGKYLINICIPLK